MSFTPSPSRSTNCTPWYANESAVVTLWRTNALPAPLFSHQVIEPRRLRAARRRLVAVEEVAAGDDDVVLAVAVDVRDGRLVRERDQLGLGHERDLRPVLEVGALAIDLDGAAVGGCGRGAAADERAVAGHDQVLLARAEHVTGDAERGALQLGVDVDPREGRRGDRVGGAADREGRGRAAENESEGRARDHDGPCAGESGHAVPLWRSASSVTAPGPMGGSGRISHKITRRTQVQPALTGDLRTTFITIRARKEFPLPVPDATKAGSHAGDPAFRGVRRGVGQPSSASKSPLRAGS